jgi:hypothetical protein
MIAMLPLQGSARFYNYLKDCAALGRSFTAENAAEETGLELGSIQAYLSEKLAGRFAHKVARGRYVARGIDQVTPRDFAALMSQRDPFEPTDSVTFKSRLERLLRDGLRCGLPVEQLALDALITAQEQSA